MCFRVYVFVAVCLFGRNLPVVVSLSANRSLVVHEQVLDDVKAVDDACIKLEEHKPKSEPFISMLAGHKVALAAEYEVVREMTRAVPAELEALALKKSEIDRLQASLKIDLTRVAQMFFPKPKAEPKAKATGKAKAKAKAVASA